MLQHRFHPFNAVVSVTLFIVGLLTATFSIDWLADNRVVAGSAAIALVGLALAPWPPRSQPGRERLRRADQ